MSREPSKILSKVAGRAEDIDKAIEKANKKLIKAELTVAEVKEELAKLLARKAKLQGAMK